MAYHSSFSDRERSRRILVLPHASPFLDRSRRQGVIMTEYMVSGLLFWPNTQEALNLDLGFGVDESYAPRA